MGDVSTVERPSLVRPETSAATLTLVTAAMVLPGVGLALLGALVDHWWMGGACEPWAACDTPTAAEAAAVQWRFAAVCTGALAIPAVWAAARSQRRVAVMACASWCALVALYGPWRGLWVGADMNPWLPTHGPAGPSLLLALGLYGPAVMVAYAFARRGAR